MNFREVSDRNRQGRNCSSNRVKCNQVRGLSSGGVGDVPDDSLGGAESVLDGESSRFNLFFSVVSAAFAGGESCQRDGQGEKSKELPLDLLGIGIRGHGECSLIERGGCRGIGMAGRET